MATMFGSLVANVLLPTKQMMLDLANLMTGPLSDLLASAAATFESLEDILEKVVLLLTG